MVKLERNDPYYALKADFKNFLYVCWKYLGLPSPTKRQYELADYLQSPELCRKMIQAFRGIGKSWICSAFVVWSLWRNLDEKFLIVSATKERADAFSMFCKNLMNLLPFLNELLPQEGQRNSCLAFDVFGCNLAQAPSVKSVGIMGQITGSRATKIIFDDVEIPGNSGTEEQREKLLGRVLEAEALKVPEGYEIIFLGTPQSEETIYWKLINKGYQPIIMPVRYLKEADKAKYKGFLSKDIQEAPEEWAGLTTEPQRFTDRYLAETEAIWGKAGFALQFMMDTSLSDALKYPLRTYDLLVLNVTSDKAPCSLSWSSDYNQVLRNYHNLGFTGDRWHKPLYIDEKWKEFEGIIMAIDPSGKGNNETAYAVVGSLHGNLFLLDSGGLRDGYSEGTLKALALIAKRHRVNTIVVEPNYGSGMFNELLKPVLQKLYPCGVDEGEWNSVQKEKRIIGVLEPILMRHKLVVAEDVIVRDIQQANNDQRYSLFYQMTRMTADKGALAIDDRIDALAMAIDWWMKAVARDDVKEAEKVAQEQVEKMVRDFLESVDQKMVGEVDWDVRRR